MTTTMTIERLGSDATEQDLARWNATIERILPAFDGEVDDAEEWLWNNGDCEARIDADICIYCDSLCADRTIVPDVDDAPAWASLAPEHEIDCEWIATRAHRLA